MKTNRSKTATTASVSTSNTSPQPVASKSKDDEIMATLQAVRSEMAVLKLKVENQQPSNNQASPRETRERRPKRACKKCVDGNVVDQCDHCFYCGNSDLLVQGMLSKGKDVGKPIRDK